MVARPEPKIVAYLIALILCLVSSPSQADDLNGYLPPDAEVVKVLELKKLEPALSNAAQNIRIDSQGRVTLMASQTLFVINEKDLTPIPLKSSGGFSSYAWTSGGALIGVKEKKLGFPGPDGFAETVDLPDEGMQLVSGHKNRLYLYGGKSREQRLHLYLLEKNKGLSHLAEMPYPITAVAGTGEQTFVAVGRSILFMAPNQPLSLVYRPRFEVMALAYAPPHGLFYATEESVGFVSKPGTGFTFMKEKGVIPMVSGNDLFLVIPHKSVLKISSIEAFAAMAVKLAEDK